MTSAKVVGLLVKSEWIDNVKRIIMLVLPDRWHFNLSRMKFGQVENLLLLPPPPPPLASYDLVESTQSTLMVNASMEGSISTARTRLIKEVWSNAVTIFMNFVT
ncbi:hypothetical protein Pelo_4346 [Pelomyxa schiedti]|nr:hypothetical protein Pelo_4346 [Pelomyxa schiedti]